MKYATLMGRSIYVHVPGTALRTFKKSDAAMAEKFHREKCLELGLSPGLAKGGEENFLPEGLRIEERKRTLKNGKTRTSRMVTATYLEDGKKVSRSITLGRDISQEEAVTKLYTWRVMNMDKGQANGKH